MQVGSMCQNTWLQLLSIIGYYITIAPKIKVANNLYYRFVMFRIGFASFSSFYNHETHADAQSTLFQATQFWYDFHYKKERIRFAPWVIMLQSLLHELNYTLTYVSQFAVQQSSFISHLSIISKYHFFNPRLYNCITEFSCYS